MRKSSSGNAECLVLNDLEAVPERLAGVLQGAARRCLVGGLD